MSEELFKHVLLIELILNPGDTDSEYRARLCDFEFKKVLTSHYVETPTDVIIKSYIEGWEGSFKLLNEDVREKLLESCTDSDNIQIDISIFKKSELGDLIFENEKVFLKSWEVHQHIELRWPRGGKNKRIYFYSPSRIKLF